MLEIANFADYNQRIIEQYHSENPYAHMSNKELFDQRALLYEQRNSISEIDQRIKFYDDAIAKIDVVLAKRNTQANDKPYLSERDRRIIKESNEREQRVLQAASRYQFNEEEFFQSYERYKNDVSTETDYEVELSDYEVSTEVSTDVTEDVSVMPTEDIDTQTKKYKYITFKTTNLAKIWNKPNQQDLKQFVIYENPRLYKKPTSLYYSIVTFLKALQDYREGKDVPTNSFIKEYAYDCDIEFYRHEIFNPPQPLQKKVVDYWELYQFRSEAINYFSSYLYMKKKFDYSLTNQYDNWVKGEKDVTVSMKKKYFDLPINEFKVLAACRSIINPRADLAKTTYEFILSRFFGFDTLQEFRDKRKIDKNLEAMYKQFTNKQHKKLKAIIHSLQRKRLLATVFFRDLCPKNIFISCEFGQDELRTKAIESEKNRKKYLENKDNKLKNNQTERVTMRKEFANPTWRVKDLTQKQKDTLIENLLNEQIFLVEKVDEMSKKLDRANDFIEIAINKLKFIDTKQHNIKDIETIINNSIATIN
jgi:hypothetical protein